MKSLFISIIIFLVISLKFALTAYSWSPEGYPYQLLEELSYNKGSEEGVEDGWYFDLYAEQGIDLFEIKINSKTYDKALFNIFVSGNLLLGGEEEKDPWNKKFETSGGVQFRLLMKGEIPQIEWGDINVGVKINHIDYFNEDIDNEVGYIGFISLGLGGDWKNQ